MFSTVFMQKCSRFLWLASKRIPNSSRRILFFIRLRNRNDIPVLENWSQTGTLRVVVCSCPELEQRNWRISQNNRKRSIFKKILPGSASPGDRSTVPGCCCGSTRRPGYIGRCARRGTTARPCPPRTGRRLATAGMGICDVAAGAFWRLQVMMILPVDFESFREDPSRAFFERVWKLVVFWVKNLRRMTFGTKRAPLLALIFSVLS